MALVSPQKHPNDAFSTVVRTVELGLLPLIRTARFVCRIRSTLS